MYHIKSDKRSQKSAQLIANALLKLTEQKAFSDITITDIEKESSVARSTFYRLFDNTVDVLSYQCDQVFLSLIAYHTSHLPEGIDAIMQAAGEYWMNHATLLKVIDQSGRQDILIESFKRNYLQIIAAYYITANPKDTVNQNYYSALLTSMISSALLTWVKNGQKETPEELWKILKKLIKEMYHLFG